MNFPAHHRAHRHFVALPLCLMIIAGITAGNAAFSSALSLPTSGREVYAHGKTAFTLAGGTSGLLEDGGSMRLSSSGMDAVLLHGEVTLAAQGYVQLQANDATIDILHGGAYVSLDDQQLTVAAIDAPLLIQWHEKDVVIVSGEQWSVGSDMHVRRSAIPSVWLLPKRDVVDSLVSVVDLSQLPVSTAMRSFLESVQAGEAAIDLGLDTVPPSLSDSRALVAVFLEREALLTVDDARLVIRMLRQHLDTQKLLRLFSLRISIGRLLAPEAALDTTAILFGPEDPDREWLLALPRLAATPSATLSDVYISAWQAAAVQAIAADAQHVLPVLVSAVAPLPASLEVQGYPAQAVLWREARTRVLDFGMPLLPTAQREALEKETNVALRTSGVQVLVDALAHEASQAATLAALPQRADDGNGEQRMSRLRAVLLESGAMFTADTTMQQLVDDAMSIQVSHVYFATPQGDIPFDFVFDTVDDVVRDIVRDGVSLPNAMPLEQFFNSLAL